MGSAQRKQTETASTLRFPQALPKSADRAIDQSASRNREMSSISFPKMFQWVKIYTFYWIKVAKIGHR